MRCFAPSADEIGEPGLDLLAGVQRAEHGDRFDGRRSERRRYVRREAGKPEHFDVQLLTGGLHGFQIRPGVMPQAEFERVAHDALLDLVAMGRKLVADRRADEVGAVGVKPFLDQQIDMAEVDIAEIDGDLFGLTRFVPQSNDLGGHYLTPSIWMIYGWLMDGSQGPSPYSNGIGGVACSISGLPSRMILSLAK